ncbi:MAG TPA: hypothetical protein VLH60_04295 [Sedimentisphaerales bacterium]|nr:hypothetical protein [Sedimentisphaerales bacterium]
MNKITVRIVLGVLLAAIMLVGSAASVAADGASAADPNTADPNTVQPAAE